MLGMVHLSWALDAATYSSFPLQTILPKDTAKWSNTVLPFSQTIRIRPSGILFFDFVYCFMTNLYQFMIQQNISWFMYPTSASFKPHEYQKNTHNYIKIQDQLSKETHKSNIRHMKQSSTVKNRLLKNQYRGQLGSHPPCTAASSAAREVLGLNSERSRHVGLTSDRPGVGKVHYHRFDLCQKGRLDT